MQNYYRKKDRITKAGHRSKIEDDIAKQIKKEKLKLGYEECRIPYMVPATDHHYIPDFGNEKTIIIEAKGRFLPEDRRMHLFLKKQRPDLDIRFIFTKADKRLSKKKRKDGTNFTCGDWCRKHGFKFAERIIPEAWIKEIKKHEAKRAKKELE